MRRTILLAGALPFVSAFLGGVLAFSLVAPLQVTAQSSEVQEVRASAFTLVGPDGTILARLAPGRVNGVGNLTLNDVEGTQRLTVNGTGDVISWSVDDTTPAFRAGRTFDLSPTGALPLNGVRLGPEGS